MSDRTDELLQEDVALLALIARRDMDNQTEAILAFLDAGLAPARVAELIGATPATVRSTRQKKTRQG